MKVLGDGRERPDPGDLGGVEGRVVGVAEADVGPLGLAHIDVETDIPVGGPDGVAEGRPVLERDRHEIGELDPLDKIRVIGEIHHAPGKGDRSFVISPAHHIEVQIGHDLGFQERGRVGHEVLGTQKALLLSAPQAEDQRPLGPLGVGGKGPGQVQHAHGTRAVVVGAVENVLLPLARVVEMGPDDHRFALELGVGSLEDADDVDAADRRRLQRRGHRDEGARDVEGRGSLRSLDLLFHVIELHPDGLEDPIGRARGDGHDRRTRPRRLFDLAGETDATVRLADDRALVADALRRHQPAPTVYVAPAAADDENGDGAAVVKILDPIDRLAAGADPGGAF